MSDRSEKRSAIPIGLRQMAAGAFFFSVMSVLVKLASRHLPSSHTVLARGVVTLVLSWAAIRRAKLSPWGVDKKRLFVRGLAGFVGLNCFYYSIKSLPLAEASVIQYTSPVFTAILAAIFLGERMGPREIVSVAASFAGVLLVAQPPFLFAASASAGEDHASAIAVAVLGAVAAAVAYVTVRKLRSTDDPTVVVFWFPLVAVPLSIAPVLRDATMPSPLEWLLLLGIGVTTQTAQVFMTKALHNEPAGRATAVSYLQVVFAYLFGVVLFGELPNAIGLAGAAIIAASVLSLAFRKSR